MAAQDAPGTEEEPAWSQETGLPLVVRTAHFDVRVRAGESTVATWPLSPAEIAATAEAVLPTVEARLETPLRERVSLLVVPAEAAPAACPPRAAALPARRRIVLFAGPETLEPRALAAFLAHELGHQLTFDRWGALGADRRLTEGLATWAAEPYWLAWRGWASLDAAVADLLATQALAPLTTAPHGCLVAAERDVYYSVWASFVDYLLRHYGWERLAAALTLPPAGEGEADYRGAFGHSLAELACAWERELGRTPASCPAAAP